MTKATREIKCCGKKEGEKNGWKKRKTVRRKKKKRRVGKEAQNEFHAKGGGKTAPGGEKKSLTLKRATLGEREKD